MMGKTKIAAIKLHNARMLRMMEILLHHATQIQGWRTADIHAGGQVGLPPEATTFRARVHPITSPSDQGQEESRIKKWTSLQTIS
jgi:hypothetical protein